MKNPFSPVTWKDGFRQPLSHLQTGRELPLLGIKETEEKGYG
jgi:hypothetical protein